MPTDNALNTEPVRDIMHYESDIWAVADLLLAASIKRSDFPAYMMPFFALVMLEGRMRNAVQRVMDKEDTNPKDDPEEFKEAFLDEKCGYNEYIVMQDKTRAAITMNDATFDGDFAHYLSAFDQELKVLLGINIERGSQRYLNMDGIVTELRKKGILFSVAQAWAKVDLSAYDNSAITTLEEHIKRKWADLSASTAGEQYTPDEYFYYNKQSLLLTEVSEKGLYVEQTICSDGKSFAVKHPVSLTVGKDEYADITQLSADEVKQIAERITEERLSLSLSVTTEEGDVYAFVPDERTILHTDSKGKTRDLGCGMFAFKATINKKGGTIYKISIEPYLVSDYEIIPHHFDAEENNREIQAFMDKYVFKPYVLTSNKVGVELNFNKEFYVPEEISSVEDILAEIKKLDPNASIKCYEIEYTPNAKFKPSGVDWIGEIPEGWEVKRIKEICDFVSRGTTPDYVDESKYKVMNQATFSKGYIDDSIVRYTCKPSADANIKIGDLLIASTGGGVLGKVLYYNREDKFFYADSHVSILRNSKEENCMKFLYYVFSTKFAEINATMVKGSTNQTELQRNYLLAHEIPIPAKAEQQSIASNLDEKCSEIDANIANLEKQIEKYKELKRALISEVVTGKRMV